MGPRDLCTGDRRAESRVGRDAAVRGNGLRQVRRGASRDGRSGAVRARAGRDGELALAIRVRPDLRRTAGHRPVRRHVQRHLGRARTQFPAGKAEHGARHLRGRRFVRPVCDVAGDAVAPRPRGLVRRPAGHGRDRLVHGADGRGADRATRRAASRVHPVRGTGDARGARTPRLHAAHRRIFRLRLPGRIPRRALARLPVGQGHAGSRGGDRAGADRPVQHRRHLHRGMAGRPDAQEVHPVGDLLRTRRRVRAVLLDA